MSPTPPRRFARHLGGALVLVVIWVALTLALLEVGLRLAAPGLGGQVGVVARTVTTGQPYAASWERAWRENRDHYYALRPNIADALQYGSPTFSFRLTTHKLWDDGLPPDEGIGFRSRPVDYAVDAVVVGDSFGFCFTEQADCWVDRLAATTGMGVVNLSQPVTGSLSHARMLADFGAPLTPPLVIWQFFGNDFNDDYGLLVWRGDIAPIADPPDIAAEIAGYTREPVDSGAFTWLRRNSALFAVGDLLLTGRWTDAPEGERLYTPQYRAVYGDGQALEFGKLYERAALDMRRPANQFGLEQTREALRASAALAAEWGGRLVVVMIPTREEAYDFLTEPIMGAAELDKHRGARLAMLDLCAELALDCLDPLADFQGRARAGEALYYADDMHLNAAGNAALAELLAAYLEELELWPRPS